MNGIQFIAPQGFCSIQSQMDGTLFTEDFAMIETLPRLYDVTKSGRCFIKPSMRGLFNSTMKYIFGNDYEKDGIEIFCKKMSHYPILIIASHYIPYIIALNQKNNHINSFFINFHFFEKIKYSNYNILHITIKLSLILDIKECKCR